MSDSFALFKSSSFGFLSGVSTSSFVISFDEVIWGGTLLAITLAIHGFGMLVTLRITDSLKARFSRSESFLTGLSIVILGSWLIILTNILEIITWATFFLLKGALSNHTFAAYAAALNYTTLSAGYLPYRWRLLEPLLGMAGLLTLAWSTAVLHVLVQDFQQHQLIIRKERRSRWAGQAGRFPLSRRMETTDPRSRRW